MKTKTIEVYSFSELSDKAKKRAIEKRRDDQEYYWHDENVKSLKAFCDSFPVKYTDFSYGFDHSFIRSEFTGEENHRELSGIRLYKHLFWNYFSVLFPGKYYGKLVNTFPDGTPIPVNKEHPAGLRHVKRYSKILRDEYCPTGYCIDCSISQPIYDFLKNPSDSVTFEDLLEKCLDSWLKSCLADYEYCFEDEHLEEEIEANEVEFDIDGDTI